jgi:hypothetical protein
VPNICFEAEQLILRGAKAAAALPKLMAVLNRTRDPSDVFSKLRPLVRPTVLLDPPPGKPYEYLPLATGAKKVSKRLRARFLRRHTPSAGDAFSKDPAVAFFTSWSNSFTEIYSRAVVRLFPLWCALLAVGARRDNLHLMPAMWGSEWGPDYARYWLQPFSALPVEQLAATPQRELVKLVWRAQATPEQLQRYFNLSEATFARRKGPRCYERAFVCDFTGMPWAHTLHPWSSVQMIAAHHGGARQVAQTGRVAVSRMRACSARGGSGGGGGSGSGRRLAGTDASVSAAGAVGATGGSGDDAVELAAASSSQLVQLSERRRGKGGNKGGGMGGGGTTGIVGVGAGGGGRQAGCPLNVVFADRKGRRKLSNIHELVEMCSRWVPAPLPSGRVLSVNCSAHNFGVGLIASLPTLWRADVLVVSHGADVINGFGMHAGASVVEVMPVHQAGCPCDMYRRLYTYQGPTVFHYHLWSTNASRAVSTDARKRGTYHSDLHVPWPSVETALAHIVRTGGRRSAYKFRRFPY